MGSKQREAHPNNTISQKRDRSCADSERASGMRCLGSVLKVQRPLLGWTGFLSCQPGLLTLIHIYDYVFGIQFQFALSVYPLPGHVSYFLPAPKLDLFTPKTKYVLLTLVSQVSYPTSVNGHLTSAQTLATKVLTIPEFSSENGSESVPRTMQVNVYLLRKQCHCYYTTMSRATSDTLRICQYFKNSLIPGPKLGLQ